MKSIQAMASAGVLALVQAGSAAAHHSAAMFDDERSVMLSGTVTEFEYVNPHSWLYVDVENDDGTVTTWGFELDAPPRLRRLGISPRHFEPGERVTVVTNPLKDGRPAGHLVGAVTAGGRTFGETRGLTPPAD